MSVLPLMVAGKVDCRSALSGASVTVAIVGAGICICWPWLPEQEASVAVANSAARLLIVSDEIDFIVSLSSLFIISVLPINCDGFSSVSIVMNRL